MNIRNAKSEELDKILEMYDNGRRFMRAHGNMLQWVNGYPSKELLEEDISKDRLFVLTDSGQKAEGNKKVSEGLENPENQEDQEDILAVFAYIQGADPTYAVIENGSWLNEEPYGTIHRMVSSGKVPRVTEAVFNWALDQCPNLRGDTHADNYVMQSAAEDYGFKMCGIIHLENGDPRIAYHVTKELKK